MIALLRKILGSDYCCVESRLLCSIIIMCTVWCFSQCFRILAIRFHPLSGKRSRCVIFKLYLNFIISEIVVLFFLLNKRRHYQRLRHHSLGFRHNFKNITMKTNVVLCTYWCNFARQDAVARVSLCNHSLKKIADCDCNYSWSIRLNNRCNK